MFLNFKINQLNPKFFQILISKIKNYIISGAIDDKNLVIIKNSFSN
jgi:hypothetical protein